MSARHPGSPGSGHKKNEDAVRDSFYESAKIANQQPPPPPVNFSMIGNGLNPGAGTTFPILKPFSIDGPAAVINIDLGKTSGHYHIVSITSDDSFFSKFPVTYIKISLGIFFAASNTSKYGSSL